MVIDTRGPHEREAQILAYRQETSRQLHKLLVSGIPLRKIASLLGAEEFLSYKEIGKGKPAVLDFDAAGFINREAAKEQPLQLPVRIEKVSDAILPPDEGETIKVGDGSGVEKKQLIPRSRYLIELLSELGQSYSIIEGKNTPTMVRDESYKIFVASTPFFRHSFSFG